MAPQRGVEGRSLSGAKHQRLRASSQATTHGLHRRGAAAGPSGSRGRRRLSVVRPRALDAAQPFDFEGRRQRASNGGDGDVPRTRLKIGIVGFGNFGQFLAKRMASQGHDVITTSRTPHAEVASKIGVRFLSSLDDFCEEHPDVVVLCTSILSTPEVVARMAEGPFFRLRRDTLIVDVLSVKEFPKRLLLREVPKEFDIVCTHPMFGPDSGKHGWDNLPFMYERVRLKSKEEDGGASVARCDTFLGIFEQEGCRMIPMSCEEHDRQAASTQFITHTVGRMLGEMAPQSTDINTKGYESLLTLVEQTCNDSFELYYGLFMYNQNATETLDAMEKAFDRTKKKLFDELHDVLRTQLFPMPVESGGGGGGGGWDEGGGGGEGTLTEITQERKNVLKPPSPPPTPRDSEGEGKGGGAKETTTAQGSGAAEASRA